MQSPREESPPERYHPRVEANVMVKLLISGQAIVSKAKDLSMAGLMLIGDPGIPRGKVTVSIPLPGDREVVASCEVKRKTPEGVALAFERLDWDDMFALARFLHPRLP